MSGSAYNIDAWYWQVSGDTNFWTSAQFAYVVPDDATFQAWAAAGNQVVAIPDRPSLSGLMTGQRLTDYLGAGLAVTFTSAPDLSSTYALDPLTLSQTGNVAKDSASGLGLPGGLVSFTYPDINGNPMAFSPAQIQGLYMAQRDYVFLATSSVAALVFLVPGAAMPPATATLPYSQGSIRTRRIRVPWCRRATETG